MNEPHYHINLFWSAEDECWIADGETRSEAVANINDAIQGWLEVARERNFPVPEPRYRPAIYAAG